MKPAKEHVSVYGSYIFLSGSVTALTVIEKSYSFFPHFMQNFAPCFNSLPQFPQKFFLTDGIGESGSYSL
jgi:hypothetical protein